MAAGAGGTQARRRGAATTGTGGVTTTAAVIATAASPCRDPAVVAVIAVESTTAAIVNRRTATTNTAPVGGADPPAVARSPRSRGIDAGTAERLNLVAALGKPATPGSQPLLSRQPRQESKLLQRCFLPPPLPQNEKEAALAAPTRSPQCLATRLRTTRSVTHA